MKRNNFFIILLWLTALALGFLTWYTASHGSLRKYKLHYPIHRAKRKPQADVYNLENFKASDVPSEGCIFFLVVSNEDDIKIPLSSREACAIESAAFFNQDKEVLVLIVRPMEDTKILNGTNKAFEALFEYSNIRSRVINLETMLELGEGIGLTGLLTKIAESKYPEEHTKNAIMFAFLYKFGGIYMETDVFTLQQLPSYDNFIGAANREILSPAVVKIKNSGPGKELLKECIQEILRVFDGKDIEGNGGGVLTRVLQRKCSKNPTKCKDFYIAPPQVFSALYEEPFDVFFRQGATQKLFEKIKDNIAINFQHRLTKNLPANLPGIPFFDFAKEVCPTVFKIDGEHF